VQPDECPLETLALLGAVYVALQMRGRSRSLARRDDSMQHSLQAYREELERRRDYYLESWRWALWPMVPPSWSF
jgi:hypothetical protein